MMTKQRREPFDPATLAASVRDVAIQARRILKDSAREPYEVGALTSRINVLQTQAENFSTNELSRWLASLSRRVESDPNAIDGSRRQSFDRGNDVGLN